jgi:hypothetical protein
MVASATKVRLFMQGGVAVGVGGTEEVGVSGVDVNIWGRGVVVGSISVGRDFVGGRKGVEVGVGAQEVIKQRKTKMNADTTLETLSESAFIYLFLLTNEEIASSGPRKSIGAGGHPPRNDILFLNFLFRFTD